MNFTTYLEQKGIIQKTISRHEREIEKYENWLLTALEKTPENATKKDLINYLGHIKEARNLSNATQSQLLQILKNYYSYLSQEQGVNNITALVKIRGIKRTHLRPILTPEELDLLCDSYYYFTQEYNPTAKELRFTKDYKNVLQGRYIALTLIAYQGLQVSEIMSLTNESFDLRKATVKIYSSRKGAERTLSLEAHQLGSIIPFLQSNTCIIDNINQLERLSKTLKTLLPKYQDFTQIRASKITNWIKIHGLRKAQYLAGHKNINSTERHISGDFETLKNDMNNFHPLR